MKINISKRVLVRFFAVIPSTIALLLMFECVSIVLNAINTASPSTSQQESKVIHAKTLVDLQKMMMDDKIPLKDYKQCPRVYDMFKNLKKCLINEIGSTENLWDFLPNITTKCGSDYLRTLFNGNYLVNQDDVKSIIFPSNLESEVHSLTIGIGGDIYVEKRLKTKLPNIHYYGADPLYETSRIFNDIGKVFQVGVAKKAALTNSSILEGGKYKWKEIKTITLPQLLAQIDTPLIDYLFMDVEGAEYGILPNLSADEMLPYTICQINVELHGPLATYGMKENDFVKVVHSLLSARSQYLPLWVPRHTMHHRFFLFNWKSAQCLKKFMTNWC